VRGKSRASSNYYKSILRVFMVWFLNKVVENYLKVFLNKQEIQNKNKRYPIDWLKGSHIDELDK
jgi:hypothetical protein